MTESQSKEVEKDPRVDRVKESIADWESGDYVGDYELPSDSSSSLEPQPSEKDENGTSAYVVHPRDGKNK